VAGLRRNQWLEWIGITGCFAPESAPPRASRYFSPCRLFLFGLGHSFVEQVRQVLVLLLLSALGMLGEFAMPFGFQPKHLRVEHGAFWPGPNPCQPVPFADSSDRERSIRSIMNTDSSDHEHLAGSVGEGADERQGVRAGHCYRQLSPLILSGVSSSLLSRP